jgi:transposase
MIHGARSIAFRMVGREDARSKWLQAPAARRGFNRAVVALANKTARIAWALLTRQEAYKPA